MRIPASERTSQKLNDLLTKGVADGDARAKFLKLAVRKIVEEALEAVGRHQGTAAVSIPSRDLRTLGECNIRSTVSSWINQFKDSLLFATIHKPPWTLPVHLLR
jgi:hypothetical protein